MVGNDPAFRIELLHHFHSSIGGGHSRVKPTMIRISSVMYWKGLKKHVRQFVKECSTCQQFKYDNLAYFGLVQPLPIPKRVWSEIFIDFIEKLPKLVSKDCIMVVVDRLSKYAHFVTFTHPFTTITIAQVFLDTINRFHGEI